MAQPPDYLVIGHVTRDLQADGSILLGGTALYAAATAARLGQRVAIATAGAVESDLQALLPEAEICCQASATTTTFVNRYQDGQRTQHLPIVAPPLDLHALPAAWMRATVIHLGPVAQEIVPDDLGTLSARGLCATPQGWLRTWDKTGRVALMPPAAHLFASVPIQVLVVSEGEEEAKAATLIEQVRARDGLVAITRGARGSALLWQHQVMAVPAYPVVEVDPTGAGDVYAAALFIRLAAGDPPLVAAAYASAAGALSVTGPGASAIPDDAAIRRLIESA